MDKGFDAIGYFAISLAILIGVFFIFRKIVLWYFMLDKIEAHLSAIRSKLEKK